jgi:hypothetical protein
MQSVESLIRTKRLTLPGLRENSSCLTAFQLASAEEPSKETEAGEQESTGWSGGGRNWIKCHKSPT